MPKGKAAVEEVVLADVKCEPSYVGATITIKDNSWLLTVYRGNEHFFINLDEKTIKTFNSETNKFELV